MSNIASPFLEYNLRLKGDRINGFEKDPTLAVAVAKNNVSLTCYPGSKDSEGRAVNIRAGMDAYTWNSVLETVEDAIGAQNGFKRGIRCYSPRKRQPGEQGRPKILTATVVIGKDQNGCVYISVVRKDPPHVKFIFRPSEYHEIMNGEGSNEDQAEVSKLYARAWVRTCRDLTHHMLSIDVHDWRADQNNNQGGGNNNRGGQGGGNNNRGGGGGSQQRSQPADDGFDDDIPI